MFTIPIKGWVSFQRVYSCVCGLPAFCFYLFVLIPVMLLVNYEEIRLVKIFNSQATILLQHFRGLSGISLPFILLMAMFWISKMWFRNKRNQNKKTSSLWVVWLRGYFEFLAIKKWAQWTFACFGMRLLNNHRLSGYQRGRGRPFTARMSLKRE